MRTTDKNMSYDRPQ